LRITLSRDGDGGSTVVPLDEGGCSASRPDRYNLGNIRGVYSVGGCVNPRDSLDARQEQNDDSLVHQPLASSLDRLCKKMHLSFLQQRTFHIEEFSVMDMKLLRQKFHLDMPKQTT
jgi:hypothetical protein